MRDILKELQAWLEEGKSVALATVVQTWGSSPRGVGSKMAITSDGEVAGSVSGGCVENAVIEAGNLSLKTNRSQLLHFGVADETAWEIGLACGGSIDIFVKPLDIQFFKKVVAVLEKERTAAVVTVIRGPAEILGRELIMFKDGEVYGGTGIGLDERFSDLAAEIFTRAVSQRATLHGEIDVFFDLILPAPTIIAVGGVHITQALMPLAKALGYRTVVVDPRKVWGNRGRFPGVDRLIQAWPEEAFQQLTISEATAIAMLTHDAKLDDPALKIALSSPAFYVGALGSKTTNAKRRERLLDDGLSEAQLSRLHAPIGLDIGAQSPEEIALAIMAEVVEAHRKRKHSSTNSVLRPEHVEGHRPELVEERRPEHVEELRPELVEGHNPEYVEERRPELVEELRPELVEGRNPKQAQGGQHLVATEADPSPIRSHS